LNLVEDKDTAFEEIYRILKPGGRLAVSDTAQKKEPPTELKEKLAAFSACFTGAIPIKLYEEKLKKAGFRGVQIINSNSDMNSYKKLKIGCSGGGCGLKFLDKKLQEVDWNDYIASVKVFAVK